MKPKPLRHADAVDLRRRTEEHLKKQPPEAGAAHSEADTLRLLHELQVHELELQMQNAELQQARTELESEKEKYSNLYDFAPAGYLTLDRGGSIVEVNLTGAGLLGIERSRLIKRRFGPLVAPADVSTFDRFLQQVFTSRTREAVEVSLLREGQPPLEARLEALACAGERECRVAILDVTGQHLAERDRLVLGKLESTGILARGIAHDFNNLLTIILLNLELGRSLAPKGEVARRLANAQTAALAANGLIQQFITFALDGEAVRQATSLSRLIQEAAQVVLAGTTVRCEFSPADDLWPVAVDEGQMKQVIRNLVQNAREAMPEGGLVAVQAENVTLGAKATPALPPGDYVRVRITDQGDGIAPPVLPKIFDPYFSTKQRGEQKGMGLGLTICHSIIQKQGGAIAVESEEGMGTTVHLHLPASRKVSPPGLAPGPTAQPRRGRILVIDDEEDLRWLVGALIKRMGHEVELAENAATAIEACQQALAGDRAFDVVVLDLTLKPGMNGREAMQKLRQIDPGVAGIIMSGYADDPALLEYERHGFKGAIAKPFDMVEFQEVLARVMDSLADGRIMP